MLINPEKDRFEEQFFDAKIIHSHEVTISSSLLTQVKEIIYTTLNISFVWDCGRVYVVLCTMEALMQNLLRTMTKMLILCNNFLVIFVLLVRLEVQLL